MRRTSLRARRGALRAAPLGVLLLAAQGTKPGAEDAAPLLDAQRAGLGEPAALAALGTVQVKGKVGFEGYSGVGDYTTIVAPTGEARLESTFEGSPPSRRCTNGKVYWMTGTAGTEIKKGWSAAADVRLFALGRHRDWREVYERAEVAGEAAVGGRACHEVLLVPKSPERLGIEPVPGEEPPAPDTWWIDRASKELMRVAIYATVSGAGWQRIVFDYMDWREVAGVRFPHRTRMTFGPSYRPIAAAFTTESVEVDAKFATSPFRPGDQVFLELMRAHARDGKRDPAFEVQSRKELRAATVRLRCGQEEVRQRLATLFPEVMESLKREGLTPAGPPFARFHASGPEVDLEAGIPVAGEIRDDGRIAASTLPGGEVVAGTHVGPYRELPRAHEALAQWLAREGRTALGGPWEVYWTEAGLERDPSKWRTEIVQPVSAKAEDAAGARGGNVSAAAGQKGEPPAPGAAPDPDLARLDVLVGTWKLGGGPGSPRGEYNFEWLEGGHFLVQRIELVQGSRTVKGIEIIGHERKFGAESRSPEIVSRFYDSSGNTLDYTWEIGEGTLTIWGGTKGSPIVFRGKFSLDRNTLTGTWEWPGGGYESVATRVVRPEGEAAPRAGSSK